LLSLIPSGPYRGFVAALTYTGMRSGEATALRVGDIDLDAGVIHVSRSITLGATGELVEQTPKGRRDRYVPLCDELRPYLAEVVRGKGAQDRVFADPRGRALTSGALVRAVDWSHIREELGRPDLRVHDLRHTFAALLFDAGVP